MAVGDLASVRIHVLSATHIQESAVSLVCITEDPLWRENVADEWIDEIGPTWVSHLSSDVHVDNITVVDVYPGDGPDVIAVPLSPLVGQVDSPELPAQVAGIVQWKTDLRGRSFRGRSFVGGLPIACVANSQQMLPEWHDWLLEIGGEHFGWFGPTGESDQGQLVVISRTAFGSPRPRPIGVVVSDVGAQIAFGTVRRRILAFH